MSKLTAAEFNERYPVGTRVVFWTGYRPGPEVSMRHRPGSIETATRTPAWTFGHGAAVVAVEGRSGAVTLTHIDVIEPEEDE